MDHFPLRTCGSRGLAVSSLGLGAAPLGRDPATAEHAERCARTVERAYDLGLRHVDTSPMYGNSERRVGVALKRNEFPGLTVSTKVGTHPARKFSYTGEDLRWSLQNSLDVLGLECVDLALIHDPPSEEPVFAPDDGFAALREMQAEGLCLNVGLGIHEHSFHRRAIEAGAVDVILTYGDFNIVRRSGDSLMRFAKDNGVGVLLGSPMMHGFLATGDEPVTIIRERPNLYSWYTRRDVEVAQEWFEWCREREVSMRHLNMQFVLSSDLPDCVLTGAANQEELETNVREATTRVPHDVWAEMIERIEELDTQGKHSE